MLAGAVLALGFAGGFVPGARAAGALSARDLAISALSTSIADNLAAAQQGQAVALQAENQLARITIALQAMQNAQTAARNLALTAPNAVPDGLQTGGLAPDSGIAAPGVANPVTDWTGAETPVQTAAAGKTTVTINQTAAQALLSWNSFNVSRDTTVDFNQQGNANWTALNEIGSTSTAPSQLLGSIQAVGHVYLINTNGIIFGGASQVNVGSLVASAAAFSASQYTANGIFSSETGQTYNPSFTNSGGAIIVQPGAQITTNVPANVLLNDGIVLLLGTQVRNAGTITTTGGQTELAAGASFVIRPGYGTTGNTASSTTRGNEIAVVNAKLKAGGGGLVENTGTISAGDGDITLAGENVVQNGVALAVTSTTQRGTIHLLTSASDPLSSVTLGPNAFTLIEPDLSSSATELDSQRSALITASANANSLRDAAASGQFDDLSQIADFEDESRIEIVSGNTVEFQGGSDSSAPGGQIAVSAPTQIQVDDGALLDVSGSYGVALAVSANALDVKIPTYDLAVNVQNYELRDNPQNRATGALNNANIYVDARTLNAVAINATTVNDYTPGGLLEVSGELANEPHTIGEYTSVGGSITLATGASGAVVAQAGSVFDIDGGSLQYASGELPQSYLLATNGQIYNADTAPADLTYAGVYGGFTVDHKAWGVSQTYADLLSAPPEVFQQGYTVGRAAGSLDFSSPTTIFEGTLEAATVNGPTQTTADPAGVTDPYLYSQSDIAEPGALDIASANAAINLNTAVSFAGQAPQAGGLATAIPGNLTGTTTLSAPAIDTAGLGALNVVTEGSIDIAAPLSFAPGAQIGLYGSSVDIGADVTAAGGSVTASQIYGTEVNGVTVLSLPKAPVGGTAIGSIVLGSGVSIDTAGLWTNLALDPSVTFTQAFLNGGAVDLASVKNLTLQTGSVIDASAGGAVGLTGAVTGGAGGAITLEAGPFNSISTASGNLTLGGSLQSVGFTRGGALTLFGPGFVIADQPPVTANPALVSLDPAFFTQGFSAYNLQTAGGITVAPGAVVNVTELTYQVTDASFATPTGASPAAAFSLLLEPLYLPNRTDTAIAQRPGASFSAEIISPSGVFSARPSLIAATTLSIGQGAAINVDPLQSITLQSASQLTIDGSLSAPGGAIAATSLFNTVAALPGPGTVSIWLGPDATLDVSSQAVSFAKAIGNRISLAPAGGSITLGGVAAGGVPGSTASVIIRQGALVKASGSAAADQLAAAAPGDTAETAQPAGQPIPVVGAGGSIALNSQEGIYNDGTLIAAAGGPGAAGGSLTMMLEADGVVSGGVEATPRLFTITQNDPGAQLAAGLTPGVSTGLTVGTAAISAQQITAGGFGSVTLFTRDAFEFTGNVTVNAAQSISLEEGYLTDSSPAGSVTLNAPYVALTGSNPGVVNQAQVSLAVITSFSAQQATGVFTVNAASITLNNQVSFGGLLPANGRLRAKADLAGFGTVDLNSSGDVQLLATNFFGGFGGSTVDNLVTTGNLDLTAREIYTVGENSFAFAAGFNPAATGGSDFTAGTALTISRTPGTTPIAPDTVGGSLLLAGATINQGGVLWQPLGTIDLGFISGTRQGFSGFPLANGDPETAVNFLSGSLTSVSAAGLNIPFGGTTDGVTYSVDGTQLGTGSGAGLETVTGGASPGIISIAALTPTLQSGAVLDLRGGGTLSGAGFIAGEDGSIDVLTGPLLNTGAASATPPSLSANPVYAIVTGVQQTQGVAYTATGTGAAPALGRQIVIPAGVPGLAAGAYTLLPAQYALEPGGYRVEFDGAAALDAAGVAALPNGSYAVAGVSAIAGTGVRATLASNLTITPGATVRTYANYDEQSYSAFLTANAASLEEVRPILPIDAGTLQLTLPNSSLFSLNNAGTTLFAAAAGGQGGTLRIGGIGAGTSLDIYGAAPTPNLPAGTISLSAEAIDAFHPFIVVMGNFENLTNPANSFVNLAGITLESGATLKAAQVVLLALNGGITLNSGSSIDTIGQGILPVDSTTEGFFSNFGDTVLDVGNGYLVYSTGTVANAPGPITVKSGADIYTQGSIAFSTAGTVNISGAASLGASYIDLAVPVINIGSTTAPGVALTAAEIQVLTSGVPALGVPALQILNLTATSSLNFYGTAKLDLGNTGVQLEINTPAIYGVGGTGDNATINAGTIVWNGVATKNVNNGLYTSGLPGAEPGPGQGTLVLNAKTIILGFSDLDIPQRDVTLTRLAAGFQAVDLNASSQITANNQSALAVYLTVPATHGVPTGLPGSGGTLDLDTPLLTAGNEATVGFTAGDGVTVDSPAGAAAGQITEAAGGEIDLTSATSTIDISTAVILPSGRLNLQAAGDITLDAGSLLNLAGVVTQNVNQTIYGFGGSVVMESAAGGITQAAGSVIDVGAVGNTAGSVAVTATGGQVALQGTLLGGSTGGHDGGQFSLRAQGLGGALSPGFAALNAALDAGGFTQSRSFDIAGPGDLTIGDGVRAQNVSVSLDDGNLTVDGTIDASGARGGEIDLAASGSLTLGADAVLEADGSSPELDSYGNPIAATDDPLISVTTSGGTLNLTPGATLNLASADGLPGGDLELNAPRIGASGPSATDNQMTTYQPDGSTTTVPTARAGADGPANAEGNGIAISAPAGINIIGAPSIALNGTAVYQNAPADPHVANSQIIDQGYLNLINTDSQAFISNFGNPAIAATIAGLANGANGSTFHLRPGVQIVSATGTGNFTVDGDLDLSGYRYGPGAVGNGAGEPGTLAIRAGGNLTINGSISDGFTGGVGQLYADTLLPQGDSSWSINLVSGADTAAAGSLVAQAASALGGGGNLTLSGNNTVTLPTGRTAQGFSVIRTGTGSLSLIAGGSFTEDSSYGIYTAGAQIPGIAGSAYDLPEGVPPSLAALDGNYQAYYPTGGGNVLVSTQGSLNGFIATFGIFSPLKDGDAIGGWLWRQGGDGQPGAWWVNFATLEKEQIGFQQQLQLVGFQGIGTLGGGNLQVVVNGSATGLDLAVASTGRVQSDGSLVQNGGGALNATIDGAVDFTQGVTNPSVAGLGSSGDASGIIADLRGDTTVSAGSIGSIQPIYGSVNGGDPRFLPPLDSEAANFGSGFDLAPGDGIVTINSRGDLMIGNAVNPGTVLNYANTTPVSFDGVNTSGGVTDFSLWTGATSIDLFSAGGDVAPLAASAGNNPNDNDFKQNLYTPSLFVTAQNGNIYFGQSQELLPAQNGELQLLAADSIIGNLTSGANAVVSISGAALSMVATPFNPDIVVTGFPKLSTQYPIFLNSPIDFGPDTPIGALHAGDTQPALVYAATGDIVNIEFGSLTPATKTVPELVLVAKPFDIYAGRDIVDSGDIPTNTLNANVSPDVFLNLTASDITSIVAGRDIVESSFDIAGPGTLLVQAGRNLDDVDQTGEQFGSTNIVNGTAHGIYSIGPLFDINPTDRNSGAAVSVLAGVGGGPDYSGFADAFLNPASTLSLINTSGQDVAGTIVQGNDAALVAWLQENAGYTGGQTGAYAYFQTLQPGQQEIFLRQLYFSLLNTSGLDYNLSSNSLGLYRTYLLGKDAIASLFPADVTTSLTPPDTGDLTLTGASGIQTQFGGGIQLLTPGGAAIVGVEGAAPPDTAGVITAGSGDIDIYAQDSVLLGESRVETTFGGNIVIWSALGNINAGKGSKTTIVFTPVQRVYDNYGDVFLSPTVPSSGAGIATLAPIPGVPPGDINLIAPAGTVDAGEAGIRVSGNFNVAALHVVNAANIQVQGTSTGVPTAVSPDIGSLTSAGNAAGAAAAAAANSTPKNQAAQQPSIWIVEILGYGGGGSQSTPVRTQQKRQPSI